MRQFMERHCAAGEAGGVFVCAGMIGDMTQFRDMLLAALAICVVVRLMGWRGNLPDPLTFLLGCTGGLLVILRMRKVMMERQKVMMERQYEQLPQVPPAEQSADQIDDAQ